MSIRKNALAGPQHSLNHRPMLLVAQAIGRKLERDVNNKMFAIDSTKLRLLQEPVQVRIIRPQTCQKGLPSGLRIGY